jgi:predicted transcriptional regulator
MIFFGENLVVEQPSSDDLLALTAEIVSAHICNNSTQSDALTRLIRLVFQTLSDVASPKSESETPVPAVPIKKSVFPDYLVCLEDGKKLKTLKRYLAMRYSMTPDDYRQKWGLPGSYPMAAPNYAETCSTRAKAIWLGRKPAPVIVQQIPEGVSARHGRTKKATS